MAGWCEWLAHPPWPLHFPGAGSGGTVVGAAVPGPLAKRWPVAPRCTGCVRDALCCFSWLCFGAPKCASAPRMAGRLTAAVPWVRCAAGRAAVGVGCLPLVGGAGTAMADREAVQWASGTIAAGGLQPAVADCQLAWSAPGCTRSRLQPRPVDQLTEADISPIETSRGAVFATCQTVFEQRQVEGGNWALGAA